MEFIRKESYPVKVWATTIILFPIIVLIMGPYTDFSKSAIAIIGFFLLATFYGFAISFIGFLACFFLYKIIPFKTILQTRVFFSLSAVAAMLATFYFLGGKDELISTSTLVLATLIILLSFIYRVTPSTGNNSSNIAVDQLG
jgi:hypothetical protein